MSPHLMLCDGPLSAAGSAAPSVLVLRCLQPSFASVCNGWLLHVGGAFLGIWYNRWCTYYQFLLRCFYLSSLRAGSCGGCYFVLRTSRAQFHGTEQLMVCAQLTTISLWAAHSKGWTRPDCERARTQRLLWGWGGATLQYGTSETRAFVRGRGPSIVAT